MCAEGGPPRLVCWSLAVSFAHGDHVVFSKEKSSPLAELARCPRCRRFHRVLVGIKRLLVLCGRQRSELPPHREHAVWETPRGACTPAQRDSGACGPVPGGSLRCLPGGRKTLHAPGASLVLVGDQERHSLCSGLPPKYPQRCARDHDANMVHLQPGYSYHVHTGPTRGLSLSKHLCSNRGW